MPDGNRLRSYDTGRGLTAFILFAILAAAAGFVIPLVPESPQVLSGAKLALEVVDRADRNHSRMQCCRYCALCDPKADPKIKSRKQYKDEKRRTLVNVLLIFCTSSDGNTFQAAVSNVLR